MHFPVLTQAFYLGTKCGSCWTRDCMKLPEDMPDPVREEERAAMCSSTIRWFRGCVWWFPRKGGKGRHWEHGGESSQAQRGVYLFKCWASFLAMSHLLGILGRKYLKTASEPGNWGVSSIWQYLSLQHVDLDAVWWGEHTHIQWCYLDFHQLTKWTKAARARKSPKTQPKSFLPSESLPGVMLS